jgi:hypothetical protein
LDGCSPPVNAPRLVNSRRPSRYKLLTFFVAAIAGIVAADYFIPDAPPWANLLLAAAVAAAVAVLMVWLGGRRKE